MKKFLTALSVVLGLGLASAQQVQPAASAAKAVPTAKAEAQKEPKAAVAAKPAVVMKKDGTPDKRYKANKHLKKDGTPDRRYKTNYAGIFRTMHNLTANCEVFSYL